MFDPEKEFIVQPSTVPQVKAYLRAFEAARGKDRHAPVWCQPLWQPSDYKKFPWCEFDVGIDAWAPQLYTAVYSSPQSHWLKLFNDEFVGMSARTMTSVTGYNWQGPGHGIDDLFTMLSMELEQRGGPGKIVFWCQPYASGDGSFGNQCDRAITALKKAPIAMPDARKNKAVRALTADGTVDNFGLALGALEAAGAKA
jgi:hypothetical protein